MPKKASRAMQCMGCSLRFAALLGFGLLSAHSGLAQTQENLDGGPADAKVFQGTNLKPNEAIPPYTETFRDLRVGAVLEPKIGPGALDISLPTISAPIVGLPVQSSPRPEDATLKIGRLYLTADALTGALLYSDNVNQQHTQRKGGAIAVIDLGITAVLQINDGLQAAVHGDIAYFPFRNKIGVLGFGVGAPLFLLGESPNFRTQLTYDFQMAGWKGVVFDDFSVEYPTLSYEPGSSAVYQGREQQGLFDAQGRYIFQANNGRYTDVAPESYGHFSPNFIVYRNAVGTYFTRLLPTDTRATLGYTHENLWYNSSSLQNGIYERDIFFTTLQSERENTRFKPFIDYAATSIDGRKTWSQLVEGGVHGPVTENLDFLGKFGYQKNPGSISDSYVWEVQFIHTPGPLTTQAITYMRRVTEPNIDAEDSLSYTFSRILGPYMNVELLAEWDRYEDLSNTGTASEVWRGSIMFQTILGPRLDARYGVSYYEENFDNPLFGGNKDLIGIIELNYHHSERTQATLGYRYEQQKTAGGALDYYENLVFLRVTRRF